MSTTPMATVTVFHVVSEFQLIFSGKFRIQRFSRPFHVTLHLDQCKIFPMLGQKLQVWSNWK